MVTVRQKQFEITKQLIAAGIEDAKYEARLLICAVTSLTAAQVLLDPPFPFEQESTLQNLIEKRINGIPLQYLLGEWEFYDLSFMVGEGVLIPRQDTEILVDTALQYLSHCQDPVYLDLCSGTGCIPIAIGQHLEKPCAHAVEYSPQAFSYLNQNITRHQANYLKPLLADALNENTLAQFADHSLDCITSNPPYLNETDMEHLQTEVRFEPEDALYAPENGYYFYRLIPKLWKEKLKTGGMLAFEVGIHQAETVRQLMEQNGFHDIQTANDYAGIARVVYGYK